MNAAEYNLLDEKWIRVIDPDFAVREVSLTQALVSAHTFTDLCGELDTQNIPVLRLMLAVLYTVFSRTDENGAPSPVETPNGALVRWKRLWDRGRFPEKPICDYLQAHRERFWLFHDETPFAQCVKAAHGTAYTAAKLNGELSESGNKVRLFPVRTGRAKESLSYAEAARWLLYANAYDDTSSKAKQKGLPSPGAGWLGKLGLIYAVGENLFQTLMLNLVLLKDGETVWPANKPAWEEPPRFKERVEIALPNNPAALFTLQSRRILLERENGSVKGYTLLGGDYFHKQNAFTEQMTVWMKVKAKANEPASFQPRRHDSARQMWRDFGAIFVNRADSRLPGVVLWTAKLKKAAILPRTRVISFKIASVKYGDKDFFVTDVFSDSLTFHFNLLSDIGAAWQSRIADEVDKCERLAYEMGRFAGNIDKAAGGDG